MKQNIDRRKWLKTSALLAGGLPFASSLLGNVSSPATPHIYQPDLDFITDEEFERNAPPALKARLSANENPFGPSDKAKQAIIEALNTSYQYPFQYSRQLQQKIADFEGIKPNNIMLAAGSSPLLLACGIMYSKPGSNIVTGDPSYDDLPGRAAKSFNTKWVKVPLTKEYKLDLVAMEKAIDENTSLVYICNPNNPTATVVDTAELKSFCERVSKKVPVFIDEAYIDYLPDPQSTTLIGLVKDMKNIIVARTFSKLYGFAGLRLGYIAADTALLDQLSKYSEGANSISTTTLQAALVAYQDKEFLQAALKKTMASKEFLYDMLKKENYSYIPSSANFVMFPIKMDGRKFYEEMMKRSVSIRNWKMNGADWCRISIGRMDEMEAFAAAFKEIS